jgi:hypothetical protein
MPRTVINPRFKAKLKKAILDIGVLVAIIVAFAIPARLVGGDTSMLP